MSARCRRKEGLVLCKPGLSANDDEKYSCQDLTVWAIFVDSDEKIVVCNGCAHAGGVRRNHGKGHGARGFALVLYNYMH